MGLRLIEAPAGEPITLAELKDHLLETSSDRDSAYLRAITAARMAIDGRHGVLGRALMTQTWELTLPTFPDRIELPLPPLQSVTSIKYRDSSNVLQTLDPAQYIVDSSCEPAVIVPTTTWPSVYGQLLEGVTVKFVAGYASAAMVPDALKHALLIRVQMMVDNLRPDEVSALSRTHTALEFPYRILVA